MSKTLASSPAPVVSDDQNTYSFVDGVWEYRHAGQLIATADLSLEMMAIGIKSHRESAERCFSHGVEHAIGAGELLIEAKKKIKHGEWLPWLETNCELARRTAQAYMQLARLPAEKRKAIAHLPVEEALVAIRDRGKVVATVRRDLESTGEVFPVEKTVGADDEERKKPARKVPDPNQEEEDRRTCIALYQKVIEAEAERAAMPDGAVAPTRHTTEPEPQGDVAVENFDTHVLELVRLMKGQRPQRFAKTAVPLPLLGDLVHYLREVVVVRKLAADDPAASAETRKAEYAASEAP
jgi:Protein of unknown function (DUF3102)